jgi:nucleoside-diphosphate kinase
MANESTLVIVKPDAIKRGLVGAAISKLEPLKLEILGAKALRPTRELAEEHYKHIRTKPFFQETVDHLQGLLSGTHYVIALVLWGENAVGRVRDVTGATNPEKADPLSIRGALGRNLATGLMENVIHASSDPVEAQREIRLWFTSEELLPPPAADREAAASKTGRRA